MKYFFSNHKLKWDNANTKTHRNFVRMLARSVLLVLIALSLCSCTKNSPDNAQGTNNGKSVSDTDAAINGSTSSVDHVLPDTEQGSQKEDTSANIVYTKNGISCTVDSATGMVTQVKSDKQTIDLSGILIEVGFNGAYQFDQLGYTSFEKLATWELPIVWPKMNPMPLYELESINETENGFRVNITKDTFAISYHYEMLENALKVSAVITTNEYTKQQINGVGFMVKGIENFNKENTTVEFPGSTPAGKIALKKYPKYSVVSTDYACPVIQYQEDKSFLNILFVNNQEKWTTGAYSDENDKPCSVFLSAVEGYIEAGEEMIIGNLYLQLLNQTEDPYLEVQDFWSKLGYHTPADSVNDGPVYSCHPYGTMDTNYFNRWTLQEYAKRLDRIASMGFKNVWLLPVFYHTGDNVYEPIDQGVIDGRYGGEEGALAFINRAHELNLRVLFDLVPHGPRPVYAFAKEHDDWISKKQDGTNQIEWECVSFDYNNPGYYDYTVDLLAYYARAFGLDGARIDCSMGGLSNWHPVEGLRPSSSGLAGGLNITKAIREGFLQTGVNPILLPENFHPLPTYAEYTDIFYDMPLFRAIHDLNHSDITETEYVKRLEAWLEAEHKTSVKGQVKLRFLGNHDTVTWTFDAERPQTFYGVEKAKSLWSILSFIDGVPFIYQGDEDPATYRLEGENLESFFTDILSARENYLPADYEISYIYTESPIFAFIRHSKDGTDTKLVLVNLSSDFNTMDLDDGTREILYFSGNYQLDRNRITLAPYTAVIVQK